VAPFFVLYFSKIYWNDQAGGSNLWREESSMANVAEKGVRCMTLEKNPFMAEETTAKHSEEVAAMMEHADRAYWVAQRIVGSAHLAEEVVQETLVELLRHPPAERGLEKMRFCFFRSVRLNAWEVRRKELNRRKREIKVSVERERNMDGNDFGVERKELPQAAQAAVASLPVEEREAVHLCCEQGFSLRAAATLLGVPRRTLDNRVHRGLEKLRKILAAQGYAAATPSAVGVALGAIALPPVPASLATTLEKATENPALFSSAQVVSQSVRKAGFFASHKLLLAAAGLLFCAAIGGGIWLAAGNVNDADLAGNKIVRNEFDSPVATPEKFYKHWSFQDGPAEDLQPIAGRWRWVRGPDGVGRMEGVKEKPEDYVSFVLPDEIPAKPLCFTFKAFPESLDATWSWGVRWATTSGDLLPYKNWSKVVSLPRNQKRATIRAYLINRWVACFLEDVLITLSDYQTAYPTPKLVFAYDSMRLEEIELRELDSPAAKKYSDLIEAKLAELERTGVAMKDKAGIRRLPDGRIELWR
jgi:RNA polymerase sigma-70 factor (ECF subfamily)